MPCKLPFILCCCAIFGCNTPDQPAFQETAKKEILEAEKTFSEMAAKDGVPAAFLAYAADEAVLNRNDQLIQGKSAIKAFFAKSTLRDVTLAWKPDFVDASSSGDMGYTWGKYQFSAVDTAGNPIKSEGLFHTVWKKQPDGKWKFVYD